MGGRRESSLQLAALPDPGPDRARLRRSPDRPGAQHRARPVSARPGVPGARAPGRLGGRPRRTPAPRLLSRRTWTRPPCPPPAPRGWSARLAGPFASEAALAPPAPRRAWNPPSVTGAAHRRRRGPSRPGPWLLPRTQDVTWTRGAFRLGPRGPPSSRCWPGQPDQTCSPRLLAFPFLGSAVDDRLGGGGETRKGLQRFLPFPRVYGEELYLPLVWPVKQLRCEPPVLRNYCSFSAGLTLLRAPYDCATQSCNNGLGIIGSGVRVGIPFWVASSEVMY